MLLKVGTVVVIPGTLKQGSTVDDFLAVAEAITIGRKTSAATEAVELRLSVDPCLKPKGFK